MRPELDFAFDDLDGGRTRVRLDFRASVPLPPGLRHVEGRIAAAGT